MEHKIRKPNVWQQGKIAGIGDEDLNALRDETVQRGEAVRNSTPQYTAELPGDGVNYDRVKSVTYFNKDSGCWQCTYTFLKNGLEVGRQTYTSATREGFLVDAVKAYVEAKVERREQWLENHPTFRGAKARTLWEYFTTYAWGQYLQGLLELQPNQLWADRIITLIEQEGLRLFPMKNIVRKANDNPVYSCCDTFERAFLAVLDAPHDPLKAFLDAAAQTKMDREHAAVVQTYEANQRKQQETQAASEITDPSKSLPTGNRQVEGVPHRNADGVLNRTQLQEMRAKLIASGEIKVK